MYKNALKEDLIRVVENLDGTVESTDTIVKLKTKIENSSTFESDPDFVKTLIQNCIDERDIAKRKREADHIKKFLLLMDIPKTPLKIDHKTLNQRLKRTIPKILKEKIKIAFICGDSSHYARDCEKRFKPKESNRPHP
ncbi:hypothetical protein TNCV_2868091 [Trichonephila clavipes]|nr:hypothetical protein TNCV_2868091 [Trichonephila clavipes]